MTGSATQPGGAQAPADGRTSPAFRAAAPTQKLLQLGQRPSCETQPQVLRTSPGHLQNLGSSFGVIAGRASRPGTDAAIDGRWCSEDPPSRWPPPRSCRPPTPRSKRLVDVCERGSTETATSAANRPAAHPSTREKERRGRCEERSIKALQREANTAIFMNKLASGL